MALFQRFIGIDYSGAQDASTPLPGLRVYSADRATLPLETPPPVQPPKHWTRKNIAEFLVDTLSGETPALVGIDHGFCFPHAYFEKYGLGHDWDRFLDDFQLHWPTDVCGFVESVREGVCGKGAARTGQSTWRRLCEQRTRAKSVFHFDVPGSVAKSTHSGLPWLRYLRKHARAPVHFWPFDGWVPEPGKSVVAEAYPALWSKAFPREGRNEHQHDAYSVAAWLREADLAGALGGFFTPELSVGDRLIADFEGWILGIR